MNKDEKQKGKYVSRSAYQKVVEENKILKKDICVLVQEGVSVDKVLLIKSWRRIIERDKQFHELLKEVANDWLDKNPEMKERIKSYSSIKK